MTENFDIFLQEGTRFDARGNNPILLIDVEQVYIVISGVVDVFSVQTRDGAATGPRLHLFRAGPGTALFGTETRQQNTGRALMAVGGTGAVMLAFPRSRFTAYASAPSQTDVIKRLVMNWIDGLSAGICKDDIAPGNCRQLEAGDQEAEDAGTSFRPAKETLWITCQSSSLRLANRPDWPAIPAWILFPVSSKTWVTTAAETQFQVLNWKSFISEDPSLDTLTVFHDFVLQCLETNAANTEKAERERLQQKSEADRTSLSRAFSLLEEILEKKKDKTKTAPGKDQALFAAVEMVAEALDIGVQAPAASKETHEPASLEDIARASGFRIRRVMLRDTWWHDDNGPLLAFTAENKLPVALLQVSPRKYRLHDPVKGTHATVTDKVAETLDMEAFVFYRPLPDRPLKGLDLLKFGIHGCKGALLNVFFMGILGALLGLLTPIMTGIIFGSIIPNAARGQLMQISIILLTSALATVLFNVTKGIALLRIEGKMDSAVQAALWDRLIALPVPFFRDYSAGDLTKRTLGINQIRQIFSGVTVNTILGCLFSSFNLALLFYYDWSLALLGVGLSLFGILVTLAASLLIVRYQRKTIEIEGNLSGMILQFITGIAKLRISGTEDRAFAAWARRFAEKKKFAFRSGTIQNLVTSFNAAFPIVASMAIFTWVIWKINDGQLSTGSFLAFNAAYGNFQMAMLQMVAALTTSLNIIPLYERIKPIITAVPEADETKAPPGELAGEIEVSNVNFRYTADGPLILKDVSLQILPGEFIALVGGSGSGKSTLLRLLLGFDAQESGTIYYDGQDLESIDIREVRRQIGVVLQNAQVMPGDIYKNIVGSSNLSIDDAWEAARMVGIDKDIEAMPMGMHTVISAGGGTLSGGQRQRLIIARAIVRRPRILFFDEATSALDNRTQAIVSRSLEKLQVSRVVIAHRLSTIINADRIYVLQHGTILETGTYEELMAQGGFFADLAQRQLA